MVDTSNLLTQGHLGVSNISNTPGSSIGLNSGQDLKRLIERREPQVFIIVVRSEHQPYATSLRLQLQRRGIPVS